MMNAMAERKKVVLTGGPNCPRCNSALSEVVRTKKLNQMIRRVRRCVHCGKQFPSKEVAEETGR